MAPRPSLIDGLQDGPRTASKVAKRAPRGPHENPKRAPREPKTLPKCPQEGPTMAPRGRQDAPRAIDRKGLDIAFCRRRRRHRRLRALLASRRSFSSPRSQAESTDRQFPMISALRKGGCFRMGWWGCAKREHSRRRGDLGGTPTGARERGEYPNPPPAPPAFPPYL